MKIESKQIGILLVVTFLCFSLPLVYAIYELPTQISYELNSTLAEVEEKVNPIIYKLIFFLVTELIVGITGVIFLLRSVAKKSQSAENDNLTKEVIEELKFAYQEEEKIDEQEKKDEVSKILSLEARLLKVSRREDFLNALVKHFEISQAAIYETVVNDDIHYLHYTFGYAFYLPENKTLEIAFGEGLIGQVAKTQKPLLITSIPENYIKIASGLGESSPTELLIIPIIIEGNTIGVVEFSSFKNFTKEQIKYLEKALFNNAEKILNLDNKHV